MPEEVSVLCGPLAEPDRGFNIYRVMCNLVCVHSFIRRRFLSAILFVCVLAGVIPAQNTAPKWVCVLPVLEGVCVFSPSRRNFF